LSLTQANDAWSAAAFAAKWGSSNQMVVSYCSTEIHAFDPTATHAMAAGFDQAWQELQMMGHVCTAPFRAKATREKLAARVLELAREGENDPGILKDYAVAYFLWSVSPASIRAQQTTQPSRRYHA
jgi:hypothetical protein